MNIVDLATVVEKFAEIKLSPRQLFFYIPLPDTLATKLSDIRKQLSLPGGASEQDLDHITLLYIPKAESEIPQAKIDEMLKDLREAAADHATIDAKVQGWGYFDGAEKDGEKMTALVALIDAPGLEDLHVDLKSVMRRHGHPEAGTHSYVPHATFAYLPKGGRVESLPTIDDEFTIDKAMLANGDKHALPLRGSPGTMAAKAASFDVNAPNATAVQTEPRDKDPGGTGESLGQKAARLAFGH